MPATFFEEVKLHEIYAKNESGAWCRLLWDDRGWVIILSDYGHWAHWWGYRGEGVSVPKFLAKLEMDYMGGKMLGSKIDEHSQSSTAQAIREHIVYMRRNEYLDKDESREEWDLAKQFADGEIPFDVWVGQSSIEDAYECHRTEIASEWRNFWERLWLPLITPELAKLP